MMSSVVYTNKEDFDRVKDILLDRKLDKKDLEETQKALDKSAFRVKGDK